MTEPYFKNVLLLSNANKFEKLLSECLVHKYKVNVKTNLHNMDKLHNVDVVIINMLEKRKEIKAEIQKIKEIETVKKIILLEDGNEIYSNSKVIPPYSVYKKLVPKNKKCLRLQQIEKMLFPDLKIEVVIFRISEMYGRSITSGIVYEMFHKRKLTLTNGERDLVYDGDVIHAIEVALETKSDGIFDIASGTAVKIKKELVPLINTLKNVKVSFRQKRKQNLSYNCENFKFYKWSPLVTLESGLNVIYKEKKHEKVQTCSS